MPILLFLLKKIQNEIVKNLCLLSSEEKAYLNLVGYFADA